MLAGANNFSVDALKAYLKSKPKTTPILLYSSFGPFMDMPKGAKQVDLTTVSKQLAAEGYTNVYLLYKGLYSVVWASGNVETTVSRIAAKTILTDHEHLY